MKLLAGSVASPQAKMKQVVAFIKKLFIIVNCYSCLKKEWLETRRKQNTKQKQEERLRADTNKTGSSQAASGHHHALAD